MKRDPYVRAPFSVATRLPSAIYTQPMLVLNQGGNQHPDRGHTQARAVAHP